MIRAARHLLAQALVEQWTVRLKHENQFHVISAEAVDVDAFYVDHTQQRLHRLGHGAAAFVPRPAALGNTDHSPKLLLIEAQLVAQVPGIGDLPG
jgi:hypothetical protein